jgi:competence protein ComEC
VLLAAAPPGECDGVTLVISAAALRGACPGVPRIDRASVARDGATAATMTPLGAMLTTDRALRGERPWVIRPQAGTVPSRLPPALTE